MLNIVGSHLTFFELNFLSIRSLNSCSCCVSIAVPTVVSKNHLIIKIYDSGNSSVIDRLDPLPYILKIVGMDKVSIRPESLHKDQCYDIDIICIHLIFQKL